MHKQFQVLREAFFPMVIVMEPHPSELQSDPSYSLIKVGSSGVLVSRDLIFITKIKGTAASLGYSMLVAGTQSQAMSMITTYRPAVVLVDLTAGEMAASMALKAYKELAGVNVRLIAFGSHVDADALAAAEAAGFHGALPRSVFTAKLPELLRQYFSQVPGKNG
jgi:DNA-binding NarL/FixJ family response regulator